MSKFSSLLKAENLRKERRRLQELQRRIAKNKSKEDLKIRRFNEKLDKDRSDTDDNEGTQVINLQLLLDQHGKNNDHCCMGTAC